MNSHKQKPIHPQSCPVSQRGKASAIASLLLLFAVSPALSQSRAKVSIDLSKPVNVLTDTSIGVPAFTFDADDFNPAGIPYLRAAGVTALRYPGNSGAADIYHWSTATTTPYEGTSPAYFAPGSNFPTFAQFAGQLGQAVIEVNYGTNMDGTGGGNPREAAAWVAYANGISSDSHSIGKDSAGQDWHTVGYWASLRGQAPLKTDDGLNFLRIRHPRPFGFRLWQIGGDVYNNGYYGGQHTGDPDLHGPALTSPADIAKLKGNAKLSPEAYAENLKAFAKAMKAVDPSILIGAAFTMPPAPNSHDWAPDWNKDVLKGACGSLDFVTLGWSMQPLLPPNWNTLDEASLLSDQGFNQSNEINGLVSTMLDDDKRNCPAGHVPRLAFAPASIATWPKVEHPMVKALWIADFYAQLVESGAVSIDWSEMYGDTMLSKDRRTLGPAFYGLQMLHIVAHSPGDLLMEATSNQSLLTVYAVRRRDGYVGLMLVNKDPKNTATVRVSFSHGSVGGAGRRIDYGNSQFTAKSGPKVSAFSAAGDAFDVRVPAYTITDILLPERK
jgi:hypothetical protein